MLVQDQVAAGAGTSIDLYGETIGAGDLTRTATLLGPTLCSPVTIADDSATTVTVDQWGKMFSLKNNGKVDASNGDDMPTQIMVAALPMLMQARERR